MPAARAASIASMMSCLVAYSPACDPAAVDGAVVCERGFESAGVGLEADGRDHVGQSVDAVGDEAAGLVDALGHAGGYPFADLVPKDA